MATATGSITNSTAQDVIPKKSHQPVNYKFPKCTFVQKKAVSVPSILFDLASGNSYITNSYSLGSASCCLCLSLTNKPAHMHPSFSCVTSLAHECVHNHTALDKYSTVESGYQVHIII